jgi:hypothetical protein
LEPGTKQQRLATGSIAGTSGGEPVVPSSIKAAQ